MNEVQRSGKMGIIELSAHAPAVYVILFFLGIILQYEYPLSISAGQLGGLLGAIFIILGTLLILWSQASIRQFRKIVAGGVSADIFKIGPYKFTRNPTYLGLGFLLAGFGFLADAAFIVFTAFIAFVLVNYTILKKEEKILAEKYGIHYEGYKSKVRRWL